MALSDAGVAAPLWALGIAVAIDRALGELPAAVHPVVWMGKLTSLLTRRAPRTPALLALAAGACVVVLVVGASGLAGWALSLWLAGSVAGSVVAGVVLSTTFAVRALGQAVSAVEGALSRGEIDHARFSLRSLCSRDPSSLDASQLSAAAIESAAENACDSFVAPLFWYALLGLPGALAYRAANTLDAMLGYRGELEWLGKVAARLDDALNFVPARITAALLVLACPTRLGPALAVYRRDAALTASPNAGRSMAVMAGLLGVRLEKPGEYVLGAELRDATQADLARAWRIVSASAWLAVLLCAAALYWRLS